jgi:hypothetical protein
MTRQEKLIAAGTALVLCLLRLPMLVPVYVSADDLVHRFAFDDAQVWRQFAGQGRPLLSAVYLLVRWLGLAPVASSPVLAVLALLLMALSAVLLARLWELTEQPLLAVLVASLLFMHPYQMDHWVFRFMPFLAALASALWLFGLLQLREGRLRGALFVVAAAAIYQTVLVQLVVVSLFGLCIASSRGADLRGWLRAPGLALGAGAIWIVLWRICSGALGLAPDGRFSFFPQPDWPARLERIRWLISTTLLDEPAFAAPLLQPLLLVLLLVLLASLLLRRKPLSAGLVLLAYGAALLTPLPLRTFWPAWRTLTPLSFFWAGALAAAPEGRPRKLLAGIALAALLGFAGVSSHVFDDEVRAGQRDREVALALRARFEAVPGWDDLHTAALTGSPAGYVDLQTANFDMNISALGISWAAVPLLRDSWGRPLDEPTAQERLLSAARCKGRPRWPSRESTLAEAGIAIVCF